MKLLTFCKKTALTLDMKISDDRNVPEQYDEPMRVLVNTMKCRINNLDSFEFPYIESVFNDEVETLLDNNTEDGEIPDGVINTLSVALYEKPYNELTDKDEKSIIKVLSVYLIISNIRRKNR